MIIWEVYYQTNDGFEVAYFPTNKKAREHRRELVQTVTLPGSVLKDEDGDYEYDDQGEVAYSERPIKLSEINIFKIQFKAKGGKALAIEALYRERS